MGSVQDSGPKQTGLVSLARPGEACSAVAEAADSRMQAVAVQVAVAVSLTRCPGSTPVAALPVPAIVRLFQRKFLSHHW